MKKLIIFTIVFMFFAQLAFGQGLNPGKQWWDFVWYDRTIESTGISNVADADSASIVFARTSNNWYIKIYDKVGALLYYFDTSGQLGLKASGYINFNTGTLGSGGYGIRDNSGTVEYKNSGGSWTAIIGSVAWDDIGDPDANDEIDFASYTIELNVEDFRIGDGGSNYWKHNAGALSNAGTATFTVADGSDIIVSANANASPFLANDGDTGTGAFDFGGAVVEIPNGTSGTTDATGEIYLDTDGDGGTNFSGEVVQVYTGAANKYLFPIALPLAASQDNYVMKYDATGKTVQWESEAGVGGGEVQIEFSAENAKLPSSNFAPIDNGENNPRLLFDASTDESVTWSAIIDDDYGAGTLYADIFFSMASATTDTVVWGAQVWAYTPGDGADINTESYATVNLDTLVVPGTAGYMKKSTITLTNDDGLAAGDHIRFKLYRDADNTSDGATNDAEVYKVIIRE